MSDTSKLVIHIKSEKEPETIPPRGTEVQVTKEDAIVKPEPKGKAPIKPKAKAKVKSQVKAKVKPVSTDDNKIVQNIANVANPLFGRAGSIHVQEEDCDDIQTIKDSPKKQRAPSNKPKAVRARKGNAADTFGGVTKQLKTKLEKDAGVVVDATILAGDGAAMLEQGTFDWVHLMKLRSDMPFRLVKSTVLRSGPYATHVAILLRQDVPFRILALPLHIRTKILRLTLKHEEPSIPIVIKQSSARSIWSPTYHARFLLAMLQTCKQIHAEAAPLVYGQSFYFPSTQVICDFLLRIGNHRRFLRSLRSETYASRSARTMFHLLAEARYLERLSFAHVSSSETPKAAVKNIWNDAENWLLGLDRNNPCKGLDVLVFDEQAFHMREKDLEAGGFKVLQWGPAEQLEFLKGLRAKMVAEEKRLKKVE